MQIRGGGRTGAVWTSALLLLILSGSALIVVRWHSTSAPGRIVQDVPEAARLPRAAAVVDHNTLRQPKHAPSASADTIAEHPRTDLVALGTEYLANRRALQEIDAMLGEADAAAETLRSQMARQDDTISAQRQALAAEPANDTERGDAQAALAAAVQMNDAARASLARFETTRSSLLKRSTLLQQRNSNIASQLKK